MKMASQPVTIIESFEYSVVGHSRSVMSGVVESRFRFR